jgi:hypothetical protein
MEKLDHTIAAMKYLLISNAEYRADYMEFYQLLQDNSGTLSDFEYIINGRSFIVPRYYFSYENLVESIDEIAKGYEVADQTGSTLIEAILIL